jgi:probable rRNA maturation factor
MAMLQVQIRPCYRHKLAEDSIYHAAEHAIQLCNLSDYIIGIIITGDREIRQLNLDYRKIDQPTDVLSFNQNYTDPETGLEYLGDVLISVPTAKKQAQIGGHSLDQEIQLLVIHGILHLSGYDHDTRLNQSKMWNLQAKILKDIDNPVARNFI